MTFSGPSGRGMESPTPFTSRVVFIAMVVSSPHVRVAWAASSIAASIFV